MALVEFYPLAGRVRRCVGGDVDDRKLEVECNGEGAVFAEASMDLSCEEFFEFAEKPNRSLMRKLLYRVEATDFLEIPPLIIQVSFTNLFFFIFIFILFFYFLVPKWNNRL